MAFKGTKKYSSFKFTFNLERELLQLQKELSEEIYSPGEYQYFTIRHPKERTISMAPFRDRVVHHALNNILEPIYEKRFIYDSYATRKNKGTHKAILRAQEFLRKNRWYLKMDIRKYFDSIHHEKLNYIIKRKIKDPFILRLCYKIILKGGDGVTGLPIGNLTSQFFANVYLDVFDHFIKEELGIKYYLRYMDDFCLFSEEKSDFKKWRLVIIDYLINKLRLLVKEKATLINTAMHGLPFLGVRIFPATIRVKRENFKRSYGRLKEKEIQYRKGLISDEQYDAGMQSLISHLKYWNSKALLCKMNKGAVS